MSFDLSIAAKRDHCEIDRRDPIEGSRSITVTLQGKLDNAAVDAVVSAVNAQFDGRCASVLIELSVVKVDQASLQELSSLVMKMRREGRDVQVAVHDMHIHEASKRLPYSRDWLLDRCDCDVSGGRRSIHLDGPAGPNS